MPRRRQLLAAGLLSVTVLAAPAVATRPETIDVLRKAATAPNTERYVQIRAADFLRDL